MRILRTIPATLAALLLAAHFLRRGEVPGVAACVALAILAFVPHRAASVVVRVGLGAGLVVWIVTLVSLVAARSAAGLPYGRLAAILVAVAVFTGLAAAVLPTARRVAPDVTEPRLSTSDPVS